MKRLSRLNLFLFVLACTYAAFGIGERATIVREANLYLSPDSSSAKLAEVERGRELVILETSRDWVHVEATLGKAQVQNGEDEEDAGDRTVTGWMLAKGMVRVLAQDGDRIIFGEAANSEDQASSRRGRRGAAQDAMRLYYRVYDFYPVSPIAGEALYRAADIRWQIERVDVNSRPSAKEKESFLRQGMDEQWMKLVIKKFPGTKWADLAGFNLIENKLCGDWQGSSKCPDKEAEIYEKYGNEHPQSPKAAEALYQAAWRRSALIEIYKTEENAKKSEESKARALALSQKIVSPFPQTDWAARAAALAFLIQQNVATYGNAID
jgi:outer membrane protein assembly factor BamD (BamD/ComL family)